MMPLEAYVQALNHGCQFKLTSSGAVSVEGKVPRLVASAIRQNRDAIKQIVKLTVIIVRTSHFGDNRIFYWVPGNTEKSRLVDLGADPGSIFTRSELAEIVEINRRGGNPNPIVQAKQLFHGRVGSLSSE